MEDAGDLRMDVATLGPRFAAAGCQARIELRLLHGFELRVDGVGVTLPMTARRLLTFLALRPRPMSRLHVAGMLWLDSPEERAVANLRSAVWRVHRPGLRLVEAGKGHIGLNSAVDVDLRRAEALARRYLDSAAELITGRLDPDWELLGAELLPDWTDEWVLIEREHHRQLGLEALESLAERLFAAGQTAKALEVSLAIVAKEPLRESAQRIAVRIFIAQGNSFDAIRQYRLYETLVGRHLGLAPSELMQRLVRPLQLAAS